MAKNVWSKVKSKSYYSSYWLGISDKKDYKSIFSENAPENTSRYDLFKLAGYKSAVANFVRILTQRNDIEVKFSVGADKNYTDGKSIILSPDLDGGEFDIAVGLALHEASHILYTDFTLLQQIGYKNSDFNLKDVWNCIEDFYIDSQTYKNSPGYRGYYQALYNKYFGAKEIIKGLNSKEFSVPTWHSYLFHLCNIRNPKRNLTALPDLKEIWETLDLKNIDRCSEPVDRLNLAHKIYEIIDRNVTFYSQKPTLDEGNESTDPSNQMSSDQSQDDSENSEPLENLTASAQKKLSTIIQRQREFFNGEPRRKRLNKRENELLKDVQEMNAEIRMVANSSDETSESKYGDSFTNPHGVRVVIVRNVNFDMIKRGVMRGHGMLDESSVANAHYRREFNHKVNNIARGVSNGKILAKKLQIRNEERITKTVRLKSGKVERRLLSELGFDNFDIFSKLNIKTYKPVTIHVSVDQSGSMAGERFEKSMELAACLASASLVIKNLHVVVTLRGETGDNPYLVYIFDSKKNTANDIMDIFPCACATGCTPEGLCFEAIESELKKQAQSSDMFFVNICDGTPGCGVTTGNGSRTTYSGYPARMHSKKQVIKMEKHGIKYKAYYLMDRHNDGYAVSSPFTDRNMEESYPGRVAYMNSPSELQVIAETFKQSLLDNL